MFLCIVGFVEHIYSEERIILFLWTYVVVQTGPTNFIREGLSKMKLVLQNMRVLGTLTINMSKNGACMAEYARFGHAYT